MIHPGDETPAIAGEKTSVILGRGLCRFEHVETPPGVSSAQAVRAARLAAESRAPFARADHVVVTGASGCSIWWWDADRVREMVGPGWTYDPSRLVPETALQSPGAGWRQVQTSDGFEAQFWRDGLLTASVWRRRPFTPDQWEAFTRAVGIDDAPEHPVEPTRVSLAISGFSRVARSTRPDTWTLVERGAVALLLVSLLGSAAYAGRAIGYDQIATQAQAALAASAAPAGQAPANAGAAGLDVVDRALSLQNKPHPLLALAELQTVLRARGVTPIQFSIEDDILQVQIQTRPDLPLQSIALALEESPWFLGVDPDLDNSTGLGNLSAQLCNPAAPGAGPAACRDEGGQR